jgi:putative Ca2+/H+ antiporter (TMEM165/GDT1 family)
MNFIGVVAALTTFLSVWFGHVAVRKIESISPRIWIPAILFIVLAFLMAFFSLSTASRPLSVAFGIFAVTLLIDALELRRQQNRVRKGHAPANPNNPRHVRILIEYPSATTHDTLKRDPILSSSANEDANHLLSNL